MPPRNTAWISDHFLSKDVSFSCSSTWRLYRVLSEKDVYFDEGPAEASAVFAAIRRGGKQAGREAIVRVRMQYEIYYLYCLEHQLSSSF